MPNTFNFCPWKYPNEKAKQNSNSSAQVLFQWLSVSEYLNPSTRTLGNENFRGKKTKFGLIHAQQGLHFTAHVLERGGSGGEGRNDLDSAHPHIPHCRGSTVGNLGATQHYGGCSSSAISECHCALTAGTQVFRGEPWKPNGKNNTQEPNIFKKVNYLFLEKAENGTG